MKQQHLVKALSPAPLYNAQLEVSQIATAPLRTTVHVSKNCFRIIAKPTKPLCTQLKVSQKLLQHRKNNGARQQKLFPKWPTSWRRGAAKVDDALTSPTAQQKPLANVCKHRHRAQRRHEGGVPRGEQYLQLVRWHLRVQDT